MMRNKNAPIIAWWSGGIASALACKIALDKWPGMVRVIFIDTHNEHIDTYRFKHDCEKWYGCEIETICHDVFTDIRHVWCRYKSLNVASGAICSTVLKREVREKWQKKNDYRAQVFGFDSSERHRAKAMIINYESIHPIFPLLRISKKEAMSIVIQARIAPPEMYALGYSNNNCFETGCVQGGAGYWQKIKKDSPLKFFLMAKMEHYLTELRNEPVTILRKGDRKIFLMKNDEWPEIGTIEEIKGRPPTPLLECNGFCGANDFDANGYDDLSLDLFDLIDGL